MTMSLETLAQEVGKKLQREGHILSTAESCSGGGLAYWITSIDGSSNWFDRGYITYSDTAKIDLLGVSPTTLESFGAVSEETVREMAAGALGKSYGDLALAITGIAGPTGGTSAKPVGTVWIGLARQNHPSIVKLHTFSGSREEIRIQSIETALGMLLAMQN